MCRKGDLPRVDVRTVKVLLALSKVGIFRLRGAIVGTHAFRCCPGLLGIEIPEAGTVTEDIDVAAFHFVSVALDDQLDPAFAEALKQIGLSSPVPGFINNRPHGAIRRVASSSNCSLPVKDLIATSPWNRQRQEHTPLHSNFWTI